MLLYLRGDNMQDALSSFFIGFLYTTALFLVCLVTVVGIKSIYLSINRYIKEKFFPSPTVCPTPIKKAVRKRKPKTTLNKSAITSIEIDPEKIDRIYVKKIS